MKNKNGNFYALCVFYFVYFMSNGLLLPFINIYFEKLGFNGAQIGQINSVALIGSMFLTPLWGIICDKTRRYKSMIGLSILLTFVITYVFSKQTVYPLVLITSIFMVSIRSCTMPISDSVCVTYCNEQQRDYGVLRAIGSFGYVVGSVVITKIAEMFGMDGPLFLIYLMALFIAMVILIPYPNVEMNKEAKSDKKQSSLFNDLKSLIKNKNYIFILVLAVFTNVVMDSAGGYVGNHLVTTLKLSSSSMGTYLLFAVVPEIFFILVVSRLIRTYGYKKVYAITCLSQILRGVIYALTSSFPIFLLTSLCHMFMTGIASVGHIQYINRSVPVRYVTTAITFYMSFYMIASALFTQIFGIVYDQLGSRYIFLLLALMSAIALVIVLTTKRFNIERNESYE